MPLSMSAKDVADTSVVPFTSCAESSFCQYAANFIWAGPVQLMPTVLPPV